MACCLAASAQTPEPPKSPMYPPPAPPADSSKLGVGIQRAMTLLATSTPQKHNTVRVLFYGQSITEQKWSKMVADDLRQRFPNADLVIENRAIGGFASQLLVKDAEEALYSFYPDLVIFHVYGSHIEYENIIKRLRERTTADILIQTDHVTRDTDLTEETDPAKILPKGEMWNSFMNFVVLPGVAQRYGAGIADVRAGWKAYLTANKLSASSLLVDGVHLNDYGCFVMANLIEPYLRYRPDLPADSWKDRVRTYAVGRDAKWQGGKLTLDFTGNRVDLLPATDGQGETLEVRIDGKRPSAFPECYSFTRSTVYPGTPWPGVKRVQYEKPLQLEDWTIHLKNASDDLKTFQFEVTGSETGPDGVGESGVRFVSKSGRIIIEPDDWHLADSRAFTKKPLPPDFAIKFSVVPLFQDTFTATKPRSDAYDDAVTVAQNLPNGKHTLELVSASGKPVPLQAVRTYKP